VAVALHERSMRLDKWLEKSLSNALSFGKNWSPFYVHLETGDPLWNLKPELVTYFMSKHTQLLWLYSYLYCHSHPLQDDTWKKADIAL